MIDMSTETPQMRFGICVDPKDLYAEILQVGFSVFSFPAKLEGEQQAQQTTYSNCLESLFKDSMQPDHKALEDADRVTRAKYLTLNQGLEYKRKFLKLYPSFEKTNITVAFKEDFKTDESNIAWPATDVTLSPFGSLVFHVSNKEVNFTQFHTPDIPKERMNSLSSTLIDTADELRNDIVHTDFQGGLRRAEKQLRDKGELQDISVFVVDLDSYLAIRETRILPEPGQDFPRAETEELPTLIMSSGATDTMEGRGMERRG